MNPSPDDLATELERLQPRRPSPRVTARLQQELTPACSGHTSLIPWRHATAWWLITAAAALLVVAVLLSRSTLPPRRAEAPPRAPTPQLHSTPPHPAFTAASPEISPEYRQIRHANYLLHAEDNGLVYVNDTVPVQRLRCRYVDASQWRDDRENVTVDFYVARDGIMLLPARIY